MQVFESVQQPARAFVLPKPEVPAVEMEGPFSHRMVKLAADNGWDLSVKYARGPWAHATLETYKIVHYISCLLVRGPLRVAAIWIADADKETPKYAFYSAIRNDQPLLLNSKELTDLLKSNTEGG